jgi:hypothetical protein
MSFMGQKSRIIYVMIFAVVVGIVTSVTTAFADEDLKNSSNPLSIIFSFFQELKIGILPDDLPTLPSSDISTAAVIVQLKDEVAELKSRLNSLENPAKIYSTELHPVTDIDCSSRNMVEAFLSGWCPHQTRTIYFIEDTRVNQDSEIAITLDKRFDDDSVTQSFCGVINQDVFNFSFQDDKTGKLKLLEDLHGFIMKCDQGPMDNQSVLRYAVINS